MAKPLQRVTLGIQPSSWLKTVMVKGSGYAKLPTPKGLPQNDPNMAL